MRMREWMALGLVAAIFAGCESGPHFATDGAGDGGAEDESSEGGGNEDSLIDLSKVVWLHADVSGWPVTSELTVNIGGGSITLDYDAKGEWPATSMQGTAVNANPWIFVNVDGTWYAATWEWFRPGQVTKPMSVVEGGHIGQSPLQSFQPSSGETYGFMVSTPARGSQRTLNERTAVVMAVWP